MDFALGTFQLSGFCISSFIFYQTLKRQQRLLNALEFMENATVFTPILLKKILNDSGPQSYLKSIKILQRGKIFLWEKFSLKVTLIVLDL